MKALALIVLALALEGGFLPPTLHFRNPDPGVSLKIVAPVGMRRRLETVLITAFAADGRGGAWIIGK